MQTIAEKCYFYHKFYWGPFDSAFAQTRTLKARSPVNIERTSKILVSKMNQRSEDELSYHGAISLFFNT